MIRMCMAFSFNDRKLEKLLEIEKEKLRIKEQVSFANKQIKKYCVLKSEWNNFFSLDGKTFWVQENLSKAQCLNRTGKNLW